MLSESQRAAVAALAKPCDVDRLIAAVIACGFDPVAYAAANPDIGPDADTALVHFLQRGLREPRAAPAGELGQGLAGLMQCPIDNRAYARQLCAGLFAQQVRAPANQVPLWNLSDPKFADGLREIGGAPYFVVGDRHSYLYVRSGLLPDGSWLAPLHLSCPGGSALGLTSSGARSYRSRLLRWARIAAPLVKAGVPVFLKFGQVDVEFVWAYRRIRSRDRRFSMAEFQAFAAESVAAYARFIEELRQQLDPAQLRICSLFPPALSDDAWTQGKFAENLGVVDDELDAAALASGVGQIEMPGLATRTLLHYLYNGLLKKMCAEQGVRYVEDFDPFLGLPGLVDAKYIRRGAGESYHLDYVPTGSGIQKILERELRA